MALDAKTPDPNDPPRGSRGVGLLLAVVLVALATGVSALARNYLSPPDVVMVYLLAIMIVAFRFGRLTSVAAALLSVAAYDFFFVAPFFTLSVEHARHLLTFAMMFAVGLTVSTLASRLRGMSDEAKAASLRARTEEMRSSLLSAVSHDLRTPLAIITGAGTALRDGPGHLGPGDRAELVDTICTEAERMERLVANLLDMTRLESGAVVLRREWVPLEEVVGSALTRLEPRLSERTLCMSLPEDLPLVSVDAVLFEQVFVNLLDNALKYAPASSPIEIRAGARDASMEIEVSDRGPGLPPGAESRVFEKFYRGVHPGTGGVGLGLPVCRGIVHAHGGTISARNQEGGGASFRILLPLVDAPSSAIAGLPEEPAGKETAP